MNTVSPAPISPPMAAVMDLATIKQSPRMRLVDRVCAWPISEEASQLGVGSIWVEGFSGAGKSDFAARLARQLGWQHIELDALVIEEPKTDQALR